MRAIRSIAMLLCLVLAAANLAADGRDELVAKVLGVTGLERQLADTSALVASLYAGERGAMDERTYAAVAAIIARQFDGQAFVDKVREELIRDYDEAMLRAILEDYRNPLFVRITKTEVEIEHFGLEKELADLDYGTVEEGRDRLFEDFINDTGLMEESAEVVVRAFRAYLVTFNLLLPEGRKLRDADIEGLVSRIRQASMSEESRIRLKSRFFLTYRGYSDAELLEYFDFNRSPEGRWLEERSRAGVAEAFDACMRSAANAMIDYFKLGSPRI